MSNNKKSWFSGSYVITFLMVCGILSWAGMVYGQNQANQEAILQGNIHIHPEKPLSNDTKVKVQPGTSVKLSVTVENKGALPSPEGKIYLRFALAKPLDNDPKSVIFQTETEVLPSIEPGQSLEVNFSNSHQWPSIIDYVRNDWLMREYQAVINFDSQEKTIGTLAVTFSAYYYPGIHKEFPTSVK